ncbi:hypothetical protein EB796_020923 [Bugula neritina]|uniref:Tetraspanin n=1 Tax=Bugula neritina TaxID=10212 RepID=A0A7J7J4H0_BUGNE|nr:hypothetical protein EB796_020923 [Bugula neritina]
MEEDTSGRGTLRKMCFIVYFVFIEIIGLGCVALAIMSMNNQAAIKLRLWSQFDKDIGNLLPYLVLGASILTVIAPILGLVGVLKKSQIIITTFFCVMTVVALIWFGIGAYCVSHHKLILDNIDIVFKQLERDGASAGSDAQQFLVDLQENMPRLSHKRNLQCCPDSEVEALYSCAASCGISYGQLFSTIVFPVVYATTFGAGGFCMLTVVFACLVSCHLDDVKPAF